MTNNSTPLSYTDIPKITITEKHTLSTDAFKQIQWHTLLDNDYITRNEVMYL